MPVARRIVFLATAALLTGACSAAHVPLLPDAGSPVADAGPPPQAADSVDFLIVKQNNGNGGNAAYTLQGIESLLDVLIPSGGPPDGIRTPRSASMPVKVIAALPPFPLFCLTIRKSTESAG